MIPGLGIWESLPQGVLMLHGGWRRKRSCGRDKAFLTINDELSVNYSSLTNYRHHSFPILPALEAALTRLNLVHLLRIHPAWVHPLIRDHSPDTFLFDGFLSAGMICRFNTSYGGDYAERPTGGEPKLTKRRPRS